MLQLPSSAWEDVGRLPTTILWMGGVQTLTWYESIRSAGILASTKGFTRPIRTWPPQHEENDKAHGFGRFEHVDGDVWIPAVKWLMPGG